MIPAAEFVRRTCGILSLRVWVASLGTVTVWKLEWVRDAERFSWDFHGVGRLVGGSLGRWFFPLRRCDFLIR